MRSRLCNATIQKLRLTSYREEQNIVKDTLNAEENRTDNVDFEELENITEAISNLALESKVIDLKSPVISAEILPSSI